MNFRIIASVKDCRDGAVKLDRETAHYLRQVLRVHKDDVGEIVLENDSVLEVRVKDLTMSEIQFSVTAKISIPPDPSPDITLVQCLPKGDKFSQILQSCTTLGIHSFLPVLSHRSIPTILEKKAATKITRWQRIVHSAALQSQRYTVPTIHKIHTFPQLIQHIKDQPYELKLVPWEDTTHTQTLKTALPSKTPDTILVVIGPEGGLTETEVTQLESAGCTPVSLGKTILRTEHAGFYTSSILKYEY